MSRLPSWYSVQPWGLNVTSRVGSSDGMSLLHTWHQRTGASSSASSIIRTFERARRSRGNSPLLLEPPELPRASGPVAPSTLGVQAVCHPYPGIPAVLVWVGGAAHGSRGLQREL